MKKNNLKDNIMSKNLYFEHLMKMSYTNRIKCGYHGLCGQKINETNAAEFVEWILLNHSYIA